MRSRRGISSPLRRMGLLLPSRRGLSSSSSGGELGAFPSRPAPLYDGWGYYPQYRRGLSSSSSGGELGAFPSRPAPLYDGWGYYPQYRRGLSSPLRRGVPRSGGVVYHPKPQRRGKHESRATSYKSRFWTNTELFHHPAK